MKILITGAGGQDGVYLIRRILTSIPSAQIFALSRNEASFFDRLRLIGGNKLVEKFKLGSEFICCNVTDPVQVTHQLDRIRPHSIFHLAAHLEPLLKPGDESKLLYENMNGLIYILEACEHFQFSPHIINAGSSLMFGTVSGGIADEKTPFKPHSIYGIGKLTAHQFADVFRTFKGQRVSTAILFNHESIFRDERWLPMKIIMGAIRIKLGKADRLHLGSIDASRDWSSAEDIVDGLYAIMSENAVNEDFVLGSGKVMKVSDLLDTVFTGLDLNWHDYVEVDDNHGRSNDHIGFAANISKAKKLLNWEPRRAAPEWTSQIKDFHLNLLGKNL